MLEQMMETQMTKSVWKFLALAAIAVAISGLSLQQANAEEQSRSVMVKEWLDKYHDANSHYAIFPNGQIFRARAKRTGIIIGRLNLWHCFRYMPLRYRGDEDTYLRTRVVQFLDENAKDIAAR